MKFRDWPLYRDLLQLIIVFGLFIWFAIPAVVAVARLPDEYGSQYRAAFNWWPCGVVGYLGLIFAAVLFTKRRFKDGFAAILFCYVAAFGFALLRLASVFFYDGGDKGWSMLHGHYFISVPWHFTLRLTVDGVLLVLLAQKGIAKDWRKSDPRCVTETPEAK